MNAGLADSKRFIIVLGFLTGIAAFSIDISLPAIPAMATALGTTLSSGQQIVGIFLLGLAIGQIPCGLLADRLGRMPVLYAGLGLFTLSGFVCAASESIEVMLVSRFFQGIAAASGSVVPRAIVRDISSGKQAARLLSIMVMIFTAAPMIAPIVGAYLTTEFGWRMPFVAVAVFGLLLLLGSKLVLRETHVPNREEHIGRQLIEGAREFASYRRSILGLLLVLLPTAAFLSLISSSSGLIIEIYGYSERTFGFVFATSALSILVASAINRRLLLSLNLMQAMGIGVLLTFIASVQLLLIAWLNEASLWWLWGNVCLFFFGAGFILANATALALDPVPKIAGVASSLIGATQTFGSALSAIAASIIYNDTIANSILIMAVLGIATSVLYAAKGLILRNQPGTTAPPEV